MKEIKTRLSDVKEKFLGYSKSCQSCGVHYGDVSIRMFFHDAGTKWNDSCKKCVNEYGENLIHWYSRPQWKKRKIVLVSDQKGEEKLFLTEEQCEKIIELEKERKRRESEKTYSR